MRRLAVLLSLMLIPSGLGGQTMSMQTYLRRVVNVADSALLLTNHADPFAAADVIDPDSLRIHERRLAEALRRVEGLSGDFAVIVPPPALSVVHDQMVHGLDMNVSLLKATIDRTRGCLSRPSGCRNLTVSIELMRLVNDARENYLTPRNRLSRMARDYGGAIDSLPSMFATEEDPVARRRPPAAASNIQRR